MSGTADETNFGGVRLLSPDAEPAAGDPWDGAPRSDEDLVPDAEIDRLFDRELPEDEAHALFRRLRQDPKHRRDLEDTTEVVRMLRRPVHTPDLTDRVLDEVDRRRRFLPAQARRLVSRGRLAAAAAIIAVVGGVAMVHREKPDLLRLTPQPKPLTNLYAAVGAEIPEARAEVSEAVAELQAPVRVVAGRFFAAEPSVRRTLSEAPQDVVFEVDPLGDRLAGIEPVDVPPPVALAAISADALGLGGSTTTAPSSRTGGTSEVASARRVAGALGRLDIEVPIGSGLTGWEGAWVPGRGWTTGENASGHGALTQTRGTRLAAASDVQKRVPPEPVFAGGAASFRAVAQARQDQRRGEPSSSREYWYTEFPEPEPEPVREVVIPGGRFRPEVRFEFPLADERFEPVRPARPAQQQPETPQPVGRGPFGLPLYR